MSFGHTAVRITKSNYSSRDSAKYYILCTTEKVTVHGTIQKAVFRGAFFVNIIHSY